MLLNILAPVVSAKSKLVPGDKIKTNKFIESSNKRFYLLMQYDGNAVIYDRKGEERPMMVAGGQAKASQDHGECSEGPFGGPSNKKWSLELYNNGVLYLKDTGKDYLYWTSRCPVAGTSLRAGTAIKGACIISPNFNNFLCMQKDGNLVLYQGHASRKHWMKAMGSDAYLTLTRNGALKILDRSKKEEHIINKNNELIDDSYSAEVTNDLVIVIKDGRGNVQIPSNSFIMSRSSRSNATKKLSPSALLVLAVMLINVIVPVASVRSRITSGQRINVGEYLESRDGSKRFVVEAKRGVIYDDNKTELQLWTNDIPDHHYYELTDRGYFCATVPRDPPRTLGCIHTSYGDMPVGTWQMSLENNGILYGRDGKGVYHWNSFCRLEVLTLPTERPLFTSCLMSPDTRNFLYIQADGRLVIYRGRKAVRSFTQLSGKGSVYLFLSKTGSLSIRSSNSPVEEYVIFNNRDGSEQKYIASITDDAKIRIEDGDGNRVALI
ncbi:MAG: hypothetical protein J3Q66DRAFT_434435 [Benniella sp.]|nr:MAG: hypothetical protein J3Q66DRAFT_434435 [Benniella sp.]